MNFVTDNFEDLIDPLKAICGITLFLRDENEITCDNSFYNNCKFKIKYSKDNIENNYIYSNEIAFSTRPTIFKNKVKKSKIKIIRDNKEFNIYYLYGMLLSYGLLIAPDSLVLKVKRLVMK